MRVTLSFSSNSANQLRVTRQLHVPFLSGGAAMTIGMEGWGVRHLAYSLICELSLSQICETSPHSGYPSKCQPPRWTEKELDTIRQVLKKLTAQRVGNPADAEDLVQETLLTMVRRAPEIELEKGLLIWAMGILRHKVGNYYRKAQRFSSFDDHVRNTMSSSPAASSPESNLHHAELCAAVDNILQDFPQHEREAVDLYLAGRQTCEIVSQLSPERYQNIVNRLHRGRKKLAKELARYGYRRSSRLRAR